MFSAHMDDRVHKDAPAKDNHDKEIFHVSRVQYNSRYAYNGSEVMQDCI